MTYKTTFRIRFVTLLLCAVFVRPSAFAKNVLPFRRHHRFSGCSGKGAQDCPYLVLGNGDTLTLSKDRSRSVLVDADGWRIVMVDPTKIAITKMDSTVRPTMNYFTKPCLLSVPEGQEIVLYVTIHLITIVKGNSTLRFTPADVYNADVKSRMSLDGMATIKISDNYLLATENYSIAGHGMVDNFIVNDKNDQSYRYIKNVGEYPLELISPEQYALQPHMRLTNAHQEEELSDNDVSAVLERFNDLDQGLVMSHRKNKDVFNEICLWYGFKGCRFVNGASARAPCYCSGTMNYCQDWYRLQGWFNSLHCLYVRVISNWLYVSGMPFDKSA